MLARRVCYYTIRTTETGETRVRFGLCRRQEAQIDASLTTWEQISALLEKKGCQLVKIRPNGTAREDKPRRKSNPRKQIAKKRDHAD